MKTKAAARETEYKQTALHGAMKTVFTGRDVLLFEVTQQLTNVTGGVIQGTSTKKGEIRPTT